jgi:hypothetical protein
MKKKTMVLHFIVTLLAMYQVLNLSQFVCTRVRLAVGGSFEVTGLFIAGWLLLGMVIGIPMLLSYVRCWERETMDAYARGWKAAEELRRGRK